MSTTTQHRTDRRHGTTNVAAALLELANQLIAAREEAAACRCLVDGLKEICDLDTVAVGLAQQRHATTIRAISGLAQVDRDTPTVRDWERLLSANSTNDPSPGQIDCGGTHEQPWCVPMRSSEGRLFGACAIVFHPTSGDVAKRSFVRTVVDVVAPFFDASLEVGRSSRWKTLRSHIGRRLARRRTWLLTTLLVVGLMIPLPLPQRCECRIEPQLRRSVAAPYNAVWRKCLVRPGDVVVVGQPLGTLDDSELRRELAAATAERDRAAKSADVHAAAGKTAAAQIDRLEVRRIEQRRALLLSRLDEIDVKSPIAGVVLSGEWERAEGTPLKQGTVLFEIAPLEKVVVEAFVPERALDRVKQGSKATVLLDARPGEVFAATIGRIHPRAAVRDEENVFTAEFVIDNTDGALRPGMQGRVEVVVEPRSVAQMIIERFSSLELPSAW